MKSKLFFVLFALVFGFALATPHQAHAAAPTAFTSARYTDNNGDGTVDRVIVVINGGVALTSCTVDSTEIGTDWTYVGNGIGGSLASATCDMPSATITFVLSGATGFTTGSTSVPTLAYNDTDGDHSIANGAGNLGTVTATTVADNATPIILSLFVYYADLNSDATVDRVVATYSEFMTCSFESGDYAVITAGTVNITSPTACSASGGSIFYTVTAASGITGGTTAPQITYTNQGTLGSVADTSGNAAATTTWTFSDGVPPHILSGAYADANHDGAVDSIILTTTPDTGLSCGSYASGDLTVNTPGTVVVNTTGNTCTGTNGTTTYTFTLATPGTANTTGGSTAPVVTYTSTTNHLRDGAFATVPTASSITLADQALPVVVSVTPASAAIRQTRTISPVIVFSEAMTTGSLTFATTPVRTYTPVWSVGNTTVTLSHSSYNSGRTMTALISAATDAAAGLNNLSGLPYSWTFRVIGSPHVGSTTVVDDTADTSDDSTADTSSMTTDDDTTTTPVVVAVLGSQPAPVIPAETAITEIKTPDVKKLPAVVPFTKNLRKGSTGDGVVVLQAYLVKNGFLTMPAGMDMGSFGPLTVKAVGDFQLKYGIATSKKSYGYGAFGPKTWAKASALAGSQ